MRILHTAEFYNPNVGGVQEVVKQISERLVSRGHDVTVATTSLPQRTKSVINGVKVRSFPISGNAMRGFTGPVHEYQDFLLSGEFDVMMNYAAQQWTTDLALPLVDRLPYARVLAPCGFSGLHMQEYAEYFAQMPSMLKHYDRLIFHSDEYQDRVFARRHGLTHCTTITNGAAAEEFEHVDPTFRQRYGIPEDVPLLLTVGSHTGLKGHRLAIEAFRRARIGKACLVIIGNKALGTRGCLPGCTVHARGTTLTSFGRKRVLLLDPPRHDVIAAYHAADLFVFGSNVECSPLVLFEAMASQTPFVTVACGNAEEIAQWGGSGVVIPSSRLSHGWVTADPGAMVVAIERLMKTAEERERLSANGYWAWRQRFTWEHIAARYERLYQELVEGRRVGAPVVGMAVESGMQ